MNHPLISSFRPAFAAAFAAFAFASSLSAETLVQYTFGTTTSTSGATTSGTNVTTSAFTRGAGLPAPTFSTAAGAPAPRSIFVTSGVVDQDISSDSTDWLGFTLAATSGNKLSLSELSFYYAYTNTSGTISGSATFDVRSSVDNYATSLATFTPAVVNSTTPAWGFASVGLTATQFQALDTVTFRIILNDGANASTNSQLRLDTVTLSGVSGVPATIPEPSSYALMAGVGGLAATGLRRRRRS